MPEGRAQQKSLELFRNDLTAVSIITFDELLGKLEHIAEMLKTAPEIGAESDPSAPSDDIAVAVASPTYVRTRRRRRGDGDAA